VAADAATLDLVIHSAVRAGKEAGGTVDVEETIVTAVPE
jgi:hypothetical protein